MIKAIKRNYFPAMRSFHLDIMATAVVPALVEVRNQQRLAISYPDLLSDFFGYAPHFVSSSVKIAGSHSPAIPVTQEEINALTETFRQIKQYIDAFNAMPQESKKIEGWKLHIYHPYSRDRNISVESAFLDCMASSMALGHLDAVYSDRAASHRIDPYLFGCRARLGATG